MVEDLTMKKIFKTVKELRQNNPGRTDLFHMARQHCREFVDDPQFSYKNLVRQGADPQAVRKHIGQLIRGMTPAVFAKLEYMVEIELRLLRIGNRHGLSAVEILDMFIAQRGDCSACSKELNFDMVIDHDHRHCPGVTGCPVCVRGILHRGCNSAIGMMHDDPDVALRFADFLVKSNTRIAPYLSGVAV